MLRLSLECPDVAPAVVIVEGRLVGPWIDELDRFVASVAGRPIGPLVLDLRECTFADARGVAVLRSLEESGARLRACSPFLTELLDGAPR